MQFVFRKWNLRRLPVQTHVVWRFRPASKIRIFVPNLDVGTQFALTDAGRAKKKSQGGRIHKAMKPQGQKFSRYEVHNVKGKIMRILITTVIAALALPLMALGQTTEEPQQTQGQTKETQTTAPAKGKKMRPGQEQSKPEAKPETGTNVQGQTNIRSRTQDVNKTEPGVRSRTGQTNV